MLEANELLQKAYVLTEQLRRFWDQPTKRATKLFLSNWMLEAVQVGNQHLTKMAERVFRHLDRILAWYDYEISTGPLEGMNNKIKTLQRQAFGFRDDEFFKLQILSLHDKERRLIGAWPSSIRKNPKPIPNSLGVVGPLIQRTARKSL